MGPKNFYNAVDQRKLGTDKIDAIQNELDSIISLPPVTSEDEGKTVVVSDQGEWELVPATKSDIMFVNVSVNGSSVTIAGGITKEQIFDAIKGGINVILREVIDTAMTDNYRYYHFMDMQVNELEQFHILTIDHITFTCIDDTSGTILRRCIKLGETNVYEEFKTPIRYVGTAHWTSGDTDATVVIGHDLSNATIDVYTSIYGLVPTDMYLIGSEVSGSDVYLEFDTDEEFDIKVVATV